MTNTEHAPNLAASGVQFEYLIVQIDQLRFAEKWAVLLGLLGLYGDGEISKEEIGVLRKFLEGLPESSMKSVVHRDPTDQTLSLDEKVAWVLNVIKSCFNISPGLNDEDIERIFPVFVKSLDRDIEEDIPSSSAKRQKVAQRIVATLELMASADGKVSEREKALIRVYKSSSKHITSVWLGLLACVLLGFTIYGIYRFLAWLF